MKKTRWIALCLAGCLLGLSACGGQGEPGSGSAAGGSAGSQTGAASSAPGAASSAQAQDALADYTVEGLGTFRLPQGFAQESGETAEPLPSRYAIFRKDDCCIQANRFGTDAYEAAGVALPADLEDYSTRSGVKNSVPEGTVFDYDQYGNYAAQFAQEDGQMCYYVLLQGEASFGSVYLTAPQAQFDAEEAALWLSGSRLE